MAENGSGESAFRDRRGENPFMPVDSRRAKTAQPTKFQSQYGDEDYSYNGRGTRNPNGQTPTINFNGRTFPREDPDVAGRRQLMQKRGIREKS